MKQAPCYMCADRKVGCHSDCQKYITWVKERGRDKRGDKGGGLYTAGYSKYIARAARKDVHDRSSGMVSYR